MSVAARLAAFVGVLALVLLAGLGLGRAVGPVGDVASPSHAEGSGAPAETGDHGGGPAHAGDGGAHADGPSGITGLAVSEAGYTLLPERTDLVVGEQVFRFRITGPDSAPLLDYDATHERELHLVVVRRDGTGFQHLHPQRAGDGTWSTPLALDAAGAYRAYADFAPAGLPARTLAVDLLVPGELRPQPWPAPTSSTAVDDLTVTVAGHLDAGEASELAFTVTRAGQPVDVEPYLGARGHLVVLREGDLGYLHVHADGDALAFTATAPSAGRYRLYLQVQVDGVVRTAELAIDAEEGHA